MREYVPIIVLVALILIFGILIGLFLRKQIRLAFSKIIDFYLEIELFWKLVGGLTIAHAGLYQWYRIYGNNDSNLLTLIGQISTLLIAIFGGYFAAKQFSEMRFEKLLEESKNLYRAAANGNNPEYSKIIRCLEAALKLNPSHSTTWANLLEAYITTGDFDRFDSKIDRLSRIAIDRDIIIEKCLRISRLLLADEPRHARVLIKQNYDLFKSALKNYWHFDELKQGTTYRTLNINSDAKKILDLFLKLMTDGLSTTEETELNGLIDRP